MRRGVVGQVEGGGGLQHIQRCLGVDRRQFRQGGVLLHDHPLHGAQPRGGQEPSPVEPRRRLGQGGGRRRIVDLVGIALVLPRPAGLRDAGFIGEDGVGLGRGVRPAGQGQHLGDVVAVGRLLLGEAGLEIVVAVGQAQAVLRDDHGVAVRRLCIGLDRHVEQRGLEVQRPAAHHRRQVAAGLGRANGVKAGRQRSPAQGVDAGLVHERAVEAAGLGRVGGGVRRRGGVLQDRSQLQLRLLRQDGVDAVAGSVGGDRQGVEEAAVGEGVEVVARLHRLVLAAGVVAPGPETHPHRNGVEGEGGAGGEHGAEQQGGAKAHGCGLFGCGLTTPIGSP